MIISPRSSTRARCWSTGRTAGFVIVASVCACAIVAEAQPTAPRAAPQWGIAAAPTTFGQSRRLAGNATPVLGGGLSLEVARALPWNPRGAGSTVFLGAGAGAVGNAGDSYDVSMLTLGVRLPARATRRWRPFVDGGFALRFAATEAADGLRSFRASTRGAAVTAGVGQNVHLYHHWSIDVALRGSIGTWSRWRRIDGSFPPNETTAVGTLRSTSGTFTLGLRWGR